MLTGLRKYTVILIVLAVCVAFLLSGHIQAQHFADIISVTVPAFMGANLMEHYFGKK